MKSTRFIVAGLLTLSSCGGGGGDGGPSAPVSVASVTVSPGQFTMVVGQTPVQFTAVARDASGNELANRAVAWSTNSSAVATVSTVGVVIAVGAGSVAITATSEGQGGSAAVVVIVPATVTALPSLGGAARASGINDGGTIVGSSVDAAGVTNAVKWTLLGGTWAITQLPGGNGAGANAINAAGDVVGVKGNRAVFWGAGGGSVVLGCAAADFGPDAAVAINSGGTVVGYRQEGSGSLQTAVAWRPGQCRQDLAGLAVGQGAEPRGIDDAGNISGHAYDAASTEWAVRWTFNGTSWNPPEKLKDGVWAGAWATNGPGDIAGSACLGTPPGCPAHAVLWPRPGNLVRTDLGTLGGQVSAAFALNSANEAVGWSETSLNTHAFIWSATTGMRDLSLFAPNNHTEAHGVNNAQADGSRQVIGFSIANSGTQQAVVWRVP